jgi:hypothetical protein
MILLLYILLVSSMQGFDLSILLSSISPNVFVWKTIWATSDALHYMDYLDGPAALAR